MAGSDQSTTAPDRVRVYVAELVELAPHVIVVQNTPETAAVRQATRAIPIIFMLVTDPVANGLVTNLARPSENLTGFTNFEFAMTGKWLEMLKEVAPRITRVALMFNPKSATYGESMVREAAAVTPSLGIELIKSHVHEPADIERVIAQFASTAGGGLVVLPDIFTTVHRQQILALVAQHRLPAIYAYRYFAMGGGLISYGVEPVNVYRQAASYVDRILKGAKPADLPVQAPTKFELVINLRTAKALGLEVPSSLLARADEVIE